MTGLSKEWHLASSGLVVMDYAKVYAKQYARTKHQLDLQILYFMGAHHCSEIEDISLRIGYSRKDIENIAHNMKAPGLLVHDLHSQIIYANQDILDIAKGEALNRSEQAGIMSQDIVSAFLIDYKDPVKKVVDDLHIDRDWMLEELRGSLAGAEPRFYNDQARRKYLEFVESQKKEGKLIKFPTRRRK